MDKKAIVSNVVTALVTTAILGIFGYFAGVFEEGQAAIDKEQIRAVLKEELATTLETTIDGETKTMSEAISSLSKNDTVILTEIGNLKGDVGDLEDAVLALASD